LFDLPHDVVCGESARRRFVHASPDDRRQFGIAPSDYRERFSSAGG